MKQESYFVFEGDELTREMCVAIFVLAGLEELVVAGLMTQGDRKQTDRGRRAHLCMKAQDVPPPTPEEMDACLRALGVIE